MKHYNEEETVAATIEHYNQEELWLEPRNSITRNKLQFIHILVSL